MATFFRESRIAKAISDRTVVYESHVRSFWNTARYDEADKMIHVVLRKKDENGKDIDVGIEFGVVDVRRVPDLQDSDNDPTIMSERLVKGLWCRMGFTRHINGKMYKRCFSKAYRYLMHCLENCQAEGDKYIMHPRFIMMILNDKIKDLPKDSEDVMELSVVNKVTIGRITKDKDEKTKQMICRIKYKEYVAPENDKWRHNNSDSDNEDTKMSEMVEKKTRWWCVRDGKRKRTPKSSPAVVILKDVEKGIVKGGALRHLDHML
ncbi:hypothetical protein HanPSC8_Chr09g0361761 [Helianthus annuus]|nr:hypothetical protein HanPSC8_Chr09g0361761 [Helianthus annuus]